MKKILMFAGLGIVFLAVNVVVTLVVAARVLPAPQAGTDETAMMDGAEVAPEDLVYIELAPEFTVNFEGEEASSFMQVRLTAVVSDSDTAGALEKHMPAVRNDLLMLFGGTERAPLLTRAGKEALLNESLEVMRATLQKNFPKANVNNLYFTRFVIQ